MVHSSSLPIMSPLSRSSNANRPSNREPSREAKWPTSSNPKPSVTTSSTRETAACWSCRKNWKKNTGNDKLIYNGNLEDKIKKTQPLQNLECISQSVGSTFNNKKKKGEEEESSKKQLLISSCQKWHCRRKGKIKVKLKKCTNSFCFYQNGIKYVKHYFFQLKLSWNFEIYLTSCGMTERHWKMM